MRRALLCGLIFLSLMPVSPVDAQSSLLTGLVSYWKLDEESGIRYDAHGGNDLTDNNTVGYDTGYLNNAAKFVVGNGEALTHIDNSDLRIGNGDFFISAYINPNTVSGQFAIVTKWEYPYEYAFYISDGKVVFNIMSGATFYLIDVGNVSTGTWSHVTAWYRYKAEIGVSLNGSKRTLPVSVAVNDTSSVFRVGTIFSNDYYQFDGLIDEIGIWKRVPTDYEQIGLQFGYPFFISASSTDITLPSGNTFRLDYDWTFGGVAIVAALMALLVLMAIYFVVDLVDDLWRGKS